MEAGPGEAGGRAGAPEGRDLSQLLAGVRSGRLPAGEEGGAMAARGRSWSFSTLPGPSTTLCLVDTPWAPLRGRELYATDRVPSRVVRELELKTLFISESPLREDGSGSLIQVDPPVLNSAELRSPAPSSPASSPSGPGAPTMLLPRG